MRSFERSPTNSLPLESMARAWGTSNSPCPLPALPQALMNFPSFGTVRRVCRNVKRWQNAAMALRWTAAGMMEAAKGFRRLKAYKQLPVLRAALAAHQSKYVTQRVEHDADAA